MDVSKLFRLTNKLEYCLINVVKQHQYFPKYFYASVSATPMRSKKKKSAVKSKDFIDSRMVRTTGGNGGDGCISLAQIFANDKAGPDGGDGGNGGHVIFEADPNIRGLEHVKTVIDAQSGQKGFNKDCSGRNGNHLIIQVPIGTVFKNDVGRVVADLYEERMMFLAARGGAGGKGNHFFASDLEPTPKIAEVGARGEALVYTLELSSMAHFGLLGFPNAGKSTLLQAITRANPKVASYPFTTLKPHLGVVQYSDLEQITVADLPGLIEGSHKNKGLGITFLRHAERCMGLLVLLDMSAPKPWNNLRILRNEVLYFSSQLYKRPQIVVANKMDMPESKENLLELKKRMRNDIIIPISAKHGENLSILLREMRDMYDIQISKRQNQLKEDTAEVTDMLA